MVVLEKGGNSINLAKPGVDATISQDNSRENLYKADLNRIKSEVLSRLPHNSWQEIRQYDYVQVLHLSIDGDALLVLAEDERVKRIHAPRQY